VFLCRRQDKWREQVVAAEDDTSPEAWTAYDFHLFEKVKTHAAAAPFGTTVFRYTQYSIKRDVFSPGDLKPDHWASKTWGVSWFVGVLPDGQVKALPVRCSSVQPLPNGGDICHSAFKIPKGLSGWARETAKRNGEDIDHHGLAQRALNVSIAFAAAAAAGVQVTVSKGKNRARFGLPVSSLKNFFGNRDRDPGGRRQPILHYLPSHARHLSDGRIVEVGEHLRGKRFFTWRGYDIQVAVPGIHYPSPEGFTAELYDPDLPHLPKNLISTPAVAKKMAAAMDDSGFVAIRQGTPTITRTAPSFPEGTK
jgi:hypothetical protein